jgi:murein DD-endopeptidase MepM/ murein hydrolase activator NlpD
VFSRKIGRPATSDFCNKICQQRTSTTQVSTLSGGGFGRRLLLTDFATLVRHYNGYVTTYAHASELMVKRGDRVKRGQIIARSGQTGNVNAPQLHFEIRKGKVPLDPTQFLPLI